MYMTEPCVWVAWDFFLFFFFNQTVKTEVSSGFSKTELMKLNDNKCPETTPQFIMTVTEWSHSFKSI